MLSEPAQVLSEPVKVLSIGLKVLSVTGKFQTANASMPSLFGMTLTVPVPIPEPTRLRHLRQTPLPTPERRVRPSVTPRSSAPLEQIRLIVAVLEALFGRRALHQVGPLLTKPAFAILSYHLHSGSWHGGRIGSIRTQQPHPDAVEASVRIQLGVRSLAAALRLDRVARRWQCTDIQLLS